MWLWYMVDRTSDDDEVIRKIQRNRCVYRKGNLSPFAPQPTPPATPFLCIIPLPIEIDTTDGIR